MFTLYEIRQNDQIEKARMVGACRVHVRSKKCVQSKGVATLGMWS